MKKIAIIYEKSNKIGQGHYFRSKRLFNLIKEKFKTKIFRIKSQKELKKVQKKKFDLFILDLKNYYNINREKKIILIENTSKKFKNLKSINPLDLNLKNSGPEYYIYPKLPLKKYFFKRKKKYNILIIQGGNDSNKQIKKLVKFIELNKNKIIFKFRLIVKTLKKINIITNLDINQIIFLKNAHQIYKDIDFAISSVGNTAFELGFIGVPTVHYTAEKREISRAKIFEKKKLGIYVTKKNKHLIVNELNKIYSNTNYRKQKINKRLKFFRKKNKLLKFITQYVKD
jgi:spore coat polysaccharide biosynthesis predicted glycosyltransferase SpsG